jgi:ankyrin repeat protein
LLVAVAVASLGLTTIAPFRVVNASAQSAVPIHQSEKSPDPLDVALLEAADDGNLRAIQRLLDAGANVNAVISGDGSPLIVAAREGSVAAVRLLLDRGAEVNLGVTGDGNALIMAAREGHLEIVQLLLDRGAEIDRVVDGDENALIQASWKGRLEVVRLLISRGANVNARVWAGASWNGVSAGEWRTPLSMALREGHQNVVNLLRSAGAAQ